MNAKVIQITYSQVVTKPNINYLGASPQKKPTYSVGFFLWGRAVRGFASLGASHAYGPLSSLALRDEQTLERVNNIFPTFVS